MGSHSNTIGMPTMSLHSGFCTVTTTLGGVQCGEQEQRGITAVLHIVGKEGGSLSHSYRLEIREGSAPEDVRDMLRTGFCVDDDTWITTIKVTLQFDDDLKNHLWVYDKDGGETYTYK